MNKIEYEELVVRRNALNKDLEKATLPKHRNMIKEQLTNVRNKISNAHKQEFKSGLQRGIN